MHSRQLYSDPPPSSSIVQKHSAAATSFSYRSFLLSFDVQAAFTSILFYLSSCQGVYNSERTVGRCGITCTFTCSYAEV